VVCLTLSGLVVAKKFLTTAVFPVPAEPINKTGFFLSIWCSNKDLRRVV